MISFRKLQLEWLSFFGDFPLETKEWKSILKYFGKRDRKLKDNKDIYDLDVLLTEKSARDYHIFLSIMKSMKKNKVAYDLAIGFHRVKAAQSSKKVDGEDIYEIDDFQNFLYTFVDKNKKMNKIKGKLAIEYSFSGKKYNLISGIPFGKSFTFAEGADILGTTSVNGMGLEFKDSKIGLEAIGLFLMKGNIKHLQQLNSYLDLSKDFINNILNISQKVASIFIKKIN